MNVEYIDGVEVNEYGSCANRRLLLEELDDPHPYHHPDNGKSFPRLYGPSCYDCYALGKGDVMVAVEWETFKARQTLLERMFACNYRPYVFV